MLNNYNLVKILFSLFHIFFFCDKISISFIRMCNDIFVFTNNNYNDPLQLKYVKWHSESTLESI